MSMISKGGGVRMSIRAKLGTLATAVALSGVATFVPFVAVADHSTAHTIEQLTAQILALQVQLTALQGASKAPSTSEKCTFTRSLTIGSRGNDVTCLQNYLMSAGHFTYSGGATGYFGSITKAAVAAWQAASDISPAAGYFGPISRAKYNMMVSDVSPPPPPPPPVPAPLPSGSATPAPVPAGSGLTVAAAADQPPTTLAPALAARIAATKVMFTASADGDVTVNSITAERQGLADDATIDSVVLLDEAGVQIGLSKTLNALHQVSLNEAFTVKAGQTKTMTVAFNRPTAGSNGGQTVKFAVVSVNAGTATVNGSFPIVGNSMTINETLTIGALASPARGVDDPGAARSSLEVGAKDFKASGARWTVGSAEPVFLEQIRFYQAGSAGSGDIKDTKIWVKGTGYPTTVSSDGKYYTALLNPAVEFDKGSIIDITISTTVEGGSNRTIDFDVQKRTDVVAKGKTFNYYIIPANGSTANTSTQGEGFTSTEPYYDAYAHTISTGSLRFEKSNLIPSGNVGVDSTLDLGSFALEAKGEPISISSFVLSFTLSGGEAGTQVDNVGLYDKNGAIVAGPKDVGSDTKVTFSDTWTVPTGYNEYKVKGKLTTDFEDSDTVQASVDPDGDITAKGQNTGLTVTASPTSSTTLNTMTVRRASLKVSVADSPTAQNVVRGINGFLFSKIQFDGTASGEDLRITTQELTITTSAGADADDLNTCQLFDGTTALNTGANVVNPSGNADNDNPEVSFALDTNLIVPKGTTKLVDVKCNISSNNAADDTFSIGIADTNDDTVVVGKETGTAVTETVTVNVGPTMTIKTGGTLAVELDSSSPSERYGIAGKTDVMGSVFKLSATNEAVKLTKFGLVLASSTASTSDVLKVTLWDGAKKVGEAVFTSGEFTATSTLTGDFIVPKDGNKLLTTKIDLVVADSIGDATTAGADTGHLVRMNGDGARTTATEGIGQSSGSTLNISAGSHTAAKGIRVVKTMPTLDRLSVPSNTLANGEMTLYRFKITADAAGDVGLFKFTFRVSSTTVATTSVFKLYAYNDSGFATQAYAANPINSNDVDCVGSSSVEAGGNDTCSSNSDQNQTYAIHAASTSHVVFFFDPVANDSTKPGRDSINVPAGAARYFELKGTVASSAAGDNVSVALVGDALFRPGYLNDNGLWPRDTLEIGDTVATSSNFVWSPNTTSTSATTTNDWLTGFLVPGLPSTEMSQQSFSK